MAEPLSLMEFLQALLSDAGLRGDFGDDPQGTLATHGLADLTPADVHDALVLVQDTQTFDYVPDAAISAAPPPPPAGDDHGAAVEYLARYLDPQQADPQQADPQQADPRQAGPVDEHRWVDPDADGPAPEPDDVPFATGDAGESDYGAGDPDGPDTWLSEHVDTAPVGSAPDAAGFDALDEFDGLDRLDGFEELPDLPPAGGDPVEPDHGHGAELPDGAS